MNLLLFACVVATIIGLLELTKAEPIVHRSVWKALKLYESADNDNDWDDIDTTKSNLTLFVSFETPDVTAAFDSDTLAKTLISIHGPHQLMTPEEYHLKRGQFVFDTLTKAHDKTKELLILNNIPFVHNHSLPICNSFLIPHANRRILKRLLQVPGVQEVVTTAGQRINLPKPQSPFLHDRSKSLFESLLKEEENSEFDEGNGGSNMQWNLEKIGVDQVWSSFGDLGQGKGVVYGVADTGVAFKHPALKDNYIGLKGKDQTGALIYDHNYAWYDGVRTPIGPLDSVGRASKSICPVAGIEPCDYQGHGTHVCSIGVGSEGVGIAPQARWMACRNMDAGVGAPQAYLTCLNFFLAPHDLQGQNPRPELRPHAVGNSYGCPDSEGCAPRALESAVMALRAAGVFMAVSAGNDGPQCGSVDAPPGLEPSIIAVAATNMWDDLAGFSSRGPVDISGISWRKPDVSAPGVQVRAAFPPADYRSLSGTSMAAPHVGGAIVLMTALCPCLERDVDQLQVVLQASSVHFKPPALNAEVNQLCGNDTPDSIPNNYFGYGRIDIAAAIKVCQQQCSQKKREHAGNEQIEDDDDEE